MSTMEDMQAFVTDMFTKILGDEEVALEYSEDPGAYLASYGATEEDLSEVDYQQAFEDACKEMPNGEEVYAKADPYEGDGGVEHITNHYVTEVYESNPTIVQNISVTNVYVEGDGNVVDVNTQQANATDGDVVQAEIDIDEPGYEPEAPKYEPEAPKYPEEPKYEAETPKYEPEAPKYEPEAPKYEPEAPKYGDDLDIDANVSETNIGVVGNYNDVDATTQQANAGGSDGGYGSGDDVDANLSSTNIGVFGDGNDVDATTQQANADGGSVAQVDAELDGFGSGELEGQVVTGGDDYGSGDEGYDDGGDDIDINASETNIEVHGNYNEVDATTQQANADGGDVFQAEIEADAGGFEAEIQAVEADGFDGPEGDFIVD